MERIQKHLDGMFKELPRNEAADRIKAEMLENLTERYEELLAQTGSAEEAERQVIAEIGTAEEIREAILLASPKKRPVFTILQIILLVLSVGYVIYVKATRQAYERMFNMMPTLILVSYVLPLLYFNAAWLGMRIITHLTLPKGIFVRNRKVRIAFLTGSIVFLALYGIMSIQEIISMIFNVGYFIPLQPYYFIWDNSYLFAIAAVFLYLGRKK